RPRTESKNSPLVRRPQNAGFFLGLGVGAAAGVGAGRIRATLVAAHRAPLLLRGSALSPSWLRASSEPPSLRPAPAPAAPFVVKKRAWGMMGFHDVKIKGYFIRRANASGC